MKNTCEGTSVDNNTDFKTPKTFMTLKNKNNKCHDKICLGFVLK